MATYENTHLVATAQYFSATDNPFVAVDINRRGLSLFGEGRQGLHGVGGSRRHRLHRPGRIQRRRRAATFLIFGGAQWSQIGPGRLGVVVTLEQTVQSANSQLLGRRLLAQTHVEF